MKKLFYNNLGELRVIIKIIRTIVLTILIAIVLALTGNLIHLKYSNYILPLSIILVILTSLLFFDKKNFAYIGITSLIRDRMYLIYGFLLCLFSNLILFFIMLLNKDITLPHKYISSLVSLNSLSTFIYFIFVGFAEEILFRGYFFSILPEKYNFWIRNIIVSSLFSMLHFINPSYNILSFIIAFCMGLLFGLMRKVTNSLWLSISYHVFWNYLQTILCFPDNGGEIFMFVIILANFMVIWKCSNRIKTFDNKPLTDYVNPN